MTRTFLVFSYVYPSAVIHTLLINRSIWFWHGRRKLQIQSLSRKHRSKTLRFGVQSRLRTDPVVRRESRGGYPILQGKPSVVHRNRMNVIIIISITSKTPLKYDREKKTRRSKLTLVCHYAIRTENAVRRKRKYEKVYDSENVARTVLLFCFSNDVCFICIYFVSSLGVYT